MDSVDLGLAEKIPMEVMEARIHRELQLSTMLDVQPNEFRFRTMQRASAVGYLVRTYPRKIETHVSAYLEQLRRQSTLVVNFGGERVTTLQQLDACRAHATFPANAGHQKRHHTL